MNRKMTTMAIGAVALAGGTAFWASAASAQPTYCIREAWYYADRKAGPDRSTEAWSYYNALFQDYNDCSGPNACNDTTIQCLPPE